MRLLLQLEPKLPKLSESECLAANKIVEAIESLHLNNPRLRMECDRSPGVCGRWPVIPELCSL
jgi:hypothetical protein